MRPMDYRYHDAVTALLAEIDPEKLIADGAPADEYESEAAEICRLADNQRLTPQTLQELWRASFHVTATAYTTENDPQLLSLYLSLLAIFTSPPPDSTPHRHSTGPENPS